MMFLDLMVYNRSDMKNEWWSKGPDKVISELDNFAPRSDSFNGVKTAIEMSMSRIDTRINSLSALLKMDMVAFEDDWLLLGDKRIDIVNVLSQSSDEFIKGFLVADGWLREGLDIFEGLRCCRLNRRLFQIENKKV